MPCGTPLPNPLPQGEREPFRRCVPHATGADDKPHARAEDLSCVRAPPPHALAVAWENTISISVPVRPPVLIWNLARLASTSALVSDRLTPPEPA